METAWRDGRGQGGGPYAVATARLGTVRRESNHAARLPRGNVARTSMQSTRVLVAVHEEAHRCRALELLHRHGKLCVVPADSVEEAFARIVAQQGGVLLTDLLPEPAGQLGALRQLRQLAPQAAVVFISTPQTESLTADVLRSGAVSYIPAALLGEMLSETLHLVLGALRPPPQRAPVMDHLVSNEWLFSFPNEPSLVPAFIDVVQTALDRFGVVDATERARIGIALEEALANALFHGNLELSSAELDRARLHAFEGQPELLIENRRRQAPYCHRRVHVRARFAPGEIRFTIRDEGPGFDRADVPDAALPENLHRPSGRGLLLMRAFMDEVVFNAAGNEVTLVRRMGARPEAGG
jgi:anti-sigma regulatory factor (Ser/Thr protein kinase)/CheY-like chemotaxis protein